MHHLLGGGVCVGVHVCLPIPLGGFFFFFCGSAVLGDVSFPMVMHKMFVVPALIILQNNGTRFAPLMYATHALRLAVFLTAYYSSRRGLRRRGDV